MKCLVKFDYIIYACLISLSILVILFLRVQNIFPTPEKISVADSRMVKLLHFARKVEGTMYEQASSRVCLSIFFSVISN